MSRWTLALRITVSWLVIAIVVLGGIWVGTGGLDAVVRAAFGGR